MLVLIVLSAVLGAANTILTKKFQISIAFSAETFLWYNFMNAAIASAVFFVMCGFKIQINSITVLFALGYAVIVFASLCVGVITLSILSIPVNSVLNACGALLLGSLAGIILFKERAGVFTVLSIVIAFVAGILPFSKHGIGNFSLRKIGICIFNFLISGVNSIYEAFCYKSKCKRYESIIPFYKFVFGSNKLYGHFSDHTYEKTKP